MKTYTESLLEIPHWLYADLEFAKDFMKRMPEKPSTDGTNGNYWSCHALTRVFGNLRDKHETHWHVVDGTFIKNNHSWLVTQLGASHSAGAFILDLYPIGVIGGPFLVYLNGWSSLSHNYTEARYNYYDNALIAYKAEALLARDMWCDIDK